MTTHKYIDTYMYTGNIFLSIKISDLQHFIFFNTKIFDLAVQKFLMVGLRYSQDWAKVRERL